MYESLETKARMAGWAEGMKAGLELARQHCLGRSTHDMFPASVSEQRARQKEARACAEAIERMAGG